MKNEKITKEIVLIDKPKGITSFDVIRQLRKKYGVKKMGHSGTLDPLATGLMIIGIGEGTKKLTKFIKLPKVYESIVLLGKETTTGDMEGETLKEVKIQSLDIKKVKKTLNEMVGKIILAVPLYSAVKISGKPLYKLARAGKKVKPPKKEMEIFWIKLLDHFKQNHYYLLKLELKVKSGTYIRSIAKEIGRRLGLPATVKELRRLKIGNFNLKDAHPLN